MVEQESRQKPEPFLTIIIYPGDTGVIARCPELEVGTGVMGRNQEETQYLAKCGVIALIESNARALVNRQSTHPLPEGITEENIRVAQRIVEALNHGYRVEDFITIS